MTRLAHGEGVDLVPVGVVLELVDPLVLAGPGDGAGRVPHAAREALDALRAVPTPARDRVQTHAVVVISVKKR